MTRAPIQATNVDAAVRWYRKRSPNATVERCIEAYELSRRSSREAKQRRRGTCIRGCGRRTSYDSTSGMCDACYRAEHAAQHGTRSKYNTGCRCDECREAHRVMHREWMQRVAGKPPEHGTENAYRNYGCRCDACRAVGSVGNSFYYFQRAARRA